MSLASAAAALGAALALALAGTARAADEDAAAIQRAFEAALAAEAAGQPGDAIAILTDLEGQTSAPRIKLELARMLFEAGDYHGARALFAKVYRRDLPYPVRRRIDVFLDDIDQRIGYLRPSLGVALDDNPAQRPRSGIYPVFGAPLAFSNTEGATAIVTWRLDALAPFARLNDRQWQLGASVDGATGGAYGARRLGGEVRLGRAELAGRAYAAVGWRGFKLDGFSAVAGFVQYQRRLTPARDRQWTMAADLELNRFPSRPSLRGMTGRLSVDFARDIGRDTTARLGAGVSLTSIRDPQWPRAVVSSQASVVRSLPRRSLNLVATVGAALVDFEGADPIFGRERQDRSASLQLAAYYGRPTLGFFPGVAVAREIRRSNVAFFDYSRTTVSVDFRRRF